MSDRFAARIMYEVSLGNPRYQQVGRLPQYGWKAFSQNDEDGILQEVFRRIGASNRQFVEIGVSDGLECNTTALLLDGWRGVWVESNSECVARARATFSSYLASGQLRIIETSASPRTIDASLGVWGIPKDVDLLSVDIDGNDYWLWRSIATHRPRVVVVEYNASWPPPLSLTVDFDEARSWNQTSYFGASLKALEILAEEKGYALVGCCYAGVNAFFVRRDLLREGLFCAPFTAENHFEPPRYELSAILSGHTVGLGRVTHIAPPIRETTVRADCRLCGGAGRRLFHRTVLGRYSVAYFECDACGSLYTEQPYWLDEAYGFAGIHIDIGMAHRAVRNWIALAIMLPHLGFTSSDVAIDYGGGTGLMTRLLRDDGFNFLTFDSFRPSYFADFYEAHSLNEHKPRLITAFEVFEHFSNPNEELGAILDAGAELIIFSTSFYDGQDLETWDYLVPECGQHVFFYSRPAFESFCAGHGYSYVHGTFLQALVKIGGTFDERRAEVAEHICRWNLPNEEVARRVQHVIRGNEHISREVEEVRERFSKLMLKAASEAPSQA